jgi:hypothetical protein
MTSLVSRLRRDGFAAMETKGESAGVVTTAPLTFISGRTELFVNFGGRSPSTRTTRTYAKRWDGGVESVTARGGVTVEILSAANGASLLGMSAPLTGDATMAHVQWAAHPDAPLAPFSGGAKGALQFRFTLAPGTRLYSFWTAVDQCGASQGFVGGGGPGAPEGVDDRGRC